MRKEKSMQEHTTREESLSEEFLEGITGAGGSASPSGNPGPGSFLNCPSCQEHAWEYAYHIYRRDSSQESIDFHAHIGETAEADGHLQYSKRQHTRAQQVFQQMAAHGHPDFPAALRQQRQNYNPRNSGYRP
jgi:hypothetical protein